MPRIISTGRWCIKLQLGSLNGVPEQIDITSQDSIGPLSIDGAVVNASCLSISAYKQMMKDKMGASKFEQIFNHAEALNITKKPTTIKSYDEFAKEIDDQIP